jgi:hypothetical protein
MVVAMMKKAKILEDQIVFQLFTMLEGLITTLETREYLFFQKHEELERLQCWMGTLHTLRDATIVDTINIAISPSALCPQVESIAPLHALQSTKNNQIIKLCMHSMFHVTDTKHDCTTLAWLM